VTTALEGGEGSASRSGRSLPPGKTRNPLYRRLGGPQGQSGQVQKILPPPGFNPQTVQLIASHCTDWATQPTSKWVAYVIRHLCGSHSLWGFRGRSLKFCSSFRMIMGCVVPNVFKVCPWDWGIFCTIRYPNCCAYQVVGKTVECWLQHCTARWWWYVKWDWCLSCSYNKRKNWWEKLSSSTWT